MSKSVVGTPLFMAPEVWRVWDGQSEQVHYDEKVGASINKSWVLILIPGGCLRVSDGNLGAGG